MSVTLKLNKARSTIALEGGIDIGLSAELKKALVEALAAGKKVSVNLGKVTDLDVTAVQLLWAAKREARVAGVDFVLDGQEPAEIRDALLGVGLDMNALFGDVE